MQLPLLLGENNSVKFNREGFRLRVHLFLGYFTPGPGMRGSISNQNYLSALGRPGIGFNPGIESLV